MPSPWNSSPSPRRSDWTSLAKERSAMISSLNCRGAPSREYGWAPYYLCRHEREYAQRAAGAVDDLQWRSNDNRPGRRQLVEIGQARQPETVGAVHDGVAGKHGIETVRLAGVRPDGLHTHTENGAVPCPGRHALRLRTRCVPAVASSVGMNPRLRPIAPGAAASD